MDETNQVLQKAKRNKSINNKSNKNNNNLFLINKDLYKKKNLDFIGKNTKTESKNNSDIIKNSINDINNKNYDKKDDDGNYSCDYIISSPSSKKIYEISNNNESEIESLIEKEEENEKEENSFLFNKLINHKRKRYPSIPILSMVDDD